MSTSPSLMCNVEGTSSMDNVDGIGAPFPSSLSVEDAGMVITVLDDNGDSTLSGLPSDVEGLCSLSPGAERGKSLINTQGTKITQVCAICHDKIKAEETAEIKGCDHSYCVTCILRWASYKSEPWCPQCRLPFSSLYVYRALDGTLLDYLVEESVCLLLRAFWFKPLVIQEPEERDDDDYDVYEESYYPSSLRLGNRRWGDSGYVRAGRKEARPVVTRQVVESGRGMGSSSRQVKGKEHVKEAEGVGRRARRAQKREQLDKMLDKK